MRPPLPLIAGLALTTALSSCVTTPHVASPPPAGWKRFHASKGGCAIAVPDWMKIVDGAAGATQTQPGNASRITVVFFLPELGDYQRTTRVMSMVDPSMKVMSQSGRGTIGVVNTSAGSLWTIISNTRPACSVKITSYAPPTGGIPVVISTMAAHLGPE
uniref:Putative lipoprotein n=2 Tax=Rhizobium rhizogenes TaxID=359 RepID=A0A7S5DSB9_RHIRH|nr:putative lipoprotein [Rhizobium rhizogenes]